MGVLIRFVVKTSICGGAIYLTNQHGLWGNGEASLKFYRKIYSLTQPYKSYLPFEIPEMPPVPDVVGISRSGWNKGIKASINFLSNLPENSKKWTIDGYNQIEKLFQNANQPVTK